MKQANQPDVASASEHFLDRLADAIAIRVAQRVKGELAGSPRISPRWLSLESAAQLMNTTKAAVRGMARAKLFPIKKMGGRVMVDVKDLEKAFLENTQWLG